MSYYAVYVRCEDKQDSTLNDKVKLKIIKAMKTMKSLFVKTLFSLANPFVQLYRAERERITLVRNAKRMAAHKQSLEYLLGLAA